MRTASPTRKPGRPTAPASPPDQRSIAGSALRGRRKIRTASPPSPLTRPDCATAADSWQSRRGCRAGSHRPVGSGRRCR
nr:hypothetical protein RSP597_03975 [Ralstonia solanacearum]